MDFPPKKILVVGDRVLITPDDGEERTRVGLYLPAMEKTPRFRPMQARVGDQAIFFRKAAVEISFEDKKYLVVPQAAILVLVRNEIPI